MDCFHQPFFQIRIWVLFDIRLPRWPTKWPPPINIRCHGNSYAVIFNRISSKFHIWNASINLSFKFEYGFCPTHDSQDGRQNGRRLSIYAVVVTLAQSSLLPSTFLSSSNTGFVRHPITMMAKKMAATYQYPLSC